MGGSLDEKIIKLTAPYHSCAAGPALQESEWYPYLSGTT